MADLRLKRAYDEPDPSDGFRVLVDRLWPRGLSKEDAHLDLWFKDIAPSAQARKDFNHDPARFAEFTGRYRAELDDNPAVEDALALLREHERVTFVYGAKDPKVNHVVVLRDYLLEQG